MKDFGENYFRYIPVRPRDVHWGLYVTGAGCSRIAPHVKYPAARHPELYDFTWEHGRTLPEFQIVYITAGQGEFESGPTGQRLITPGTVFLLFPGVWHRYRPACKTGWDEYWVSFAGRNMESLQLEGFFVPERAVLKAGPAHALLSPFHTLLERLRDEVPGFPHLIAADTMELLAAILAATASDSIELVAKGPRDITTFEDRIVAEAMRLIWEQSHEPLTVEKVARQLPLTRRSLERRFRTVVGHTIHEEIVHCRVERATRLLTNTNLSIQEVAMAAGFASTDTIRRTFQRVQGVSPRDYRRKHASHRIVDEKDE
ncbi:MAG: AraC family transcriptional regulator [Pirellulales bacterium]|nr:AraC family transcriptional regulator [Pirellulales bacterium]